MLPVVTNYSPNSCPLYHFRFQVNNSSFYYSSIYKGPELELLEAYADEWSHWSVPEEAYTIPDIGRFVVLDRDSALSVSCRDTTFYWADGNGISARSRSRRVFEVDDDDQDITCQAVRIYGNRLIVLLLDDSKSSLEIKFLKKFWQLNNQGQSCVTQRISSKSRRLYVDACSDFIVTTDPCKRILYCFGYHGECKLQERLPTMHHPLGVHILPNDDVIISDNGKNSVSRYSLNFAVSDVELVWTCTDIKSPTGITSDNKGVIYVASNKGYIYFLSPNGKTIINVFTLSQCIAKTVIDSLRHQTVARGVCPRTVTLLSTSTSNCLKVV